jgi:hypothetical protein
MALAITVVCVVTYIVDYNSLKIICEQENKVAEQIMKTNTLKTCLAESACLITE